MKEGDVIDITDGFEMVGSGRSGGITYRRGHRKVELYWERSGVPQYDIVFAPVDLRHWDEPKGEAIPRHEQIEILHKLRSWTRSQGIRSDIDLPLEVKTEDVPCVWVGCNEPRISGPAFCRMHYDENLLRQ